MHRALLACGAIPPDIDVDALRHHVARLLADDYLIVITVERSRADDPGKAGSRCISAHHHGGVTIGWATGSDATVERVEAYLVAALTRGDGEAARIARKRGETWTPGE